MKPAFTQLIQRSWIRKGFSLVETLMATGIISTAALGTLGLLAGSMNSSQEGAMRSKATVIAQDLFHDLQIGALNVIPAVTDERQTHDLRPVEGPDFNRHVLFFDRAGMPISGQGLTGSVDPQIYNHGTKEVGVEWLVSIEGIQDPSSFSTNGAGQVTSLPVTADVGPLGNSAAYPFPEVDEMKATDPTLTRPPTVLTQVRISIESPPSAPPQSRKKFSYDFLWNR